MSVPSTMVLIISDNTAQEDGLFVDTANATGITSYKVSHCRSSF